MYNHRAITVVGNHVDLDIRDEALARFGNKIKSGIRVKSRFGMSSIIGICRQGRLWFKFDQDSGVSYLGNITDQKSLLKEGITFFNTTVATIAPLKNIATVAPLINIAIEQIKKEPEKIKEAMLNNEKKLPDNFYINAYNTLDINNVKRSDAPALFDTLTAKLKEEMLQNSIDKLEQQVQELTVSNKMIIEQHAKLLSLVEEMMNQKPTETVNANQKLKRSRSPSAMF